MQVGLSRFDGDTFYAEAFYERSACRAFIEQELAAVREDRFHVPRVYELVEYAKQFPVVEIDHLFYNHERDNFYNLGAVMARYCASVPEYFRFNVRLPSIITKEHKLHEVGHELFWFFEGIRELGPALDHVVLSFDRSFTRDEQFDTFSTFISHLPARYRYVISFEDPSWYVPAVFHLLSRHAVLLCRVVTLGTAQHHARFLKDYAYLRLVLPEKDEDHVDRFMDAVLPHLRPDACIILSMPLHAAKRAKRRIDAAMAHA